MFVTLRSPVSLFCLTARIDAAYPNTIFSIIKYFKFISGGIAPIVRKTSNPDEPQDRQLNILAMIIGLFVLGMTYVTR
jgi:hypothetical protein